MGHPIDIFALEPSPSCICIICHEVVELASSLKECGHTFCNNCIETSFQDSNLCPTCRVETSGCIPNFFARDTVDEVQVMCNPEAHQDDDDGNKKRKRDDDDDDDDDDDIDNHCNWKGPLQDLKNHKKHCSYRQVCCPVDGCTWLCLQKDVDSHLTSSIGTREHMRLLDKKMKKLEQSMNTKIEQIQAKCDKEIEALSMGTFHWKYINDCRSWIEYKPDALYDFTIYQITSRAAGHGQMITALLCYIPGPSGSNWEGARIPMTLRYGGGLGKPPKCQFPKGFFHPNIYPRGTVGVSTLNEEAGWTSETTLPEILFSVQQLLCHPNFSSPAQANAYNVYTKESPDEYHRRTKVEANNYTNNSTDEHHLKVKDMLKEGEVLDTRKGEIVKRAERMAGSGGMNIGSDAQQQRPSTPPFETDANGNEVLRSRNDGRREYSKECTCSCCAWGQTFWDEKKKTRFLFELGG